MKQCTKIVSVSGIRILLLSMVHPYAAQEVPSKVVKDHVQRNAVEQLCETLAQKE
jgi:hypothetical protein